MNYIIPVIVSVIVFVGFAFLIGQVFTARRRNKQLSLDVEVYVEQAKEACERLGVIGASTQELVNQHNQVVAVNNSLRESLEAERKASKEILSEAARFEANFGELSKKYGQEVIQNDNLVKEVQRWKDEASKNLSHRKSSEVRVGKIAENFAPILETFPYPMEICRFIGDPIDFICFCEDGVHFVEVKSGEAQLTTKQREIRDQIKDGKVSFETYKIKPVQ